MSMNKDFDYEKIKAEKPELCKLSLEETIRECKDLDQLFELWEIAHKNESSAKENAEDAKRSTFPDRAKYKTCEGYSEDFCESFCRDGYLETNKTNGLRILFVFRECNISDLVDRNGVLQKHKNNDEKFWLHKIYCNECGETEESGKKYKKFIDKYKEMFETNAGWCTVACMNLNKRGGFGKHNSSRLEHYVIKYREFIRREIEIVDPDIIVCGGTYGHVIKSLPTPPMVGREKIKIVDCYHPSHTREKSECHVYSFDEEWKRTE